MERTLTEIAPVVYAVRTPTADKSHTAYVCRLLCLASGKMCFTVGDDTEELAAGDIVFLAPGEFVSFDLVPDGASVSEVFFDFFAYTAGIRRDPAAHVTAEDFDPLCCSPTVRFDGTDVFDARHRFRCPDAVKMLSLMPREDAPGDYAELCRRGLLTASLAVLASAENDVLHGTKARTAAEITAYIREHAEQPLSPGDVARRFSLHVNYVNSLVKQYTGQSLGMCIKTAKVRAADRLLSESDLGVSEIAERLGYFDYSHFYKAYKSVTGCAPKRKGVEKSGEQEAAVPCVSLVGEKMPF